MTSTTNENLEKLQKMEEELKELKRSETLKDDISKNGYEQHLINIIINLQDLNRLFHQFDRNNLLGLIQDFRMYLSNNLEIFCKNLVETNKSIVECDMNKLQHSLDRLHDRIDLYRDEIENLSAKMDRLNNKSIDLKVYVNDKVEITTDIRDKMKISIDELQFSVRTSNLLSGLEVQTVGDLIRKKESDLLRSRNFGRKCLTEIKNKLKELDLSLGMEI